MRASPRRTPRPTRAVNSSCCTRRCWWPRGRPATLRRSRQGWPCWARGAALWRSRRAHPRLLPMSKAFVHPSAFVDVGATIGDGTKVWHFCHVMPGAVIGERCSLGQNVVVMPGTRIGNNVKIQNNVSIYEGVVLEDDVFCGPSMVFTLSLIHISEPTR